MILRRYFKKNLINQGLKANRWLGFVLDRSDNREYFFNGCGFV